MSFYRKHERVTFNTEGPVMTKQSFKDECDINNILRQYQQTGIIQHIRADYQAGAYFDLPSETDYQQALHIIMQGEQAFAALPAKVRLEFNNDPEQFLAAFTDEKQTDRLRELGLIDPVEPSTGDASARQEPSAAPVDGSSSGGGTSAPT